MTYQRGQSPRSKQAKVSRPQITINGDKILDLVAEAAITGTVAALIARQLTKE